MMRGYSDGNECQKAISDGMSSGRKSTIHHLSSSIVRGQIDISSKNLPLISRSIKENRRRLKTSENIAITEDTSYR
ncbi:hypothetical protein KAZ93_01035, partial [Patescibacteria group bacterium]|nr:hypothetical protein [Patescibacteria group bacterium]